MSRNTLENEYKTFIIINNHQFAGVEVDVRIIREINPGQEGYKRFYVKFIEIRQGN